MAATVRINAATVRTNAATVRKNGVVAVMYGPCRIYITYVAPNLPELLFLSGSNDGQMMSRIIVG